MKRKILVFCSFVSIFDKHFSDSVIVGGDGGIIHIFIFIPDFGITNDVDFRFACINKNDVEANVVITSITVTYVIFTSFSVFKNVCSLVFRIITGNEDFHCFSRGFSINVLVNFIEDVFVKVYPDMNVGIIATKIAEKDY